MSENRNVNKRLLNDAENYSGAASGTVFSKIFGGMIVPFFIILYGLRTCIIHHAALMYKGGTINLSGTEAVIYGVVLISTGFFIHFHFFWTVSERLYRWAASLKIVALIIFTVSLALLLWRMLQ